MTPIFETYLHALAKTYARGEGTEHSGRGALENLLSAFAGRADRKLKVQHEPKRQDDKGAPDFRISKSGQIIGYIENKKIGERLSAILKTEQIKKYRALSENLILTNYLDFIWIEGDKTHEVASLAHESEIDSAKPRLKPENVKAVEKLLTGFFSTPPQGIGQVDKLATALAVRSQMLRNFLGEELVRQEREHKEGRLFGLYGVFKEQVFHELTLKEFADAFAQTLSYGLFLAKLNAELQTITLDNARQFVPGAFRLIRELVQFLDELKSSEYREIRWVVEEILSIVNGLDIASIHEGLAFKSRRSISRKLRAQDEEEWRLFSRDPFVFFYEPFLAKYDKEMKKSRGVYYTPPPIVNFIVRAVDDILKDKFGIADGLADYKRVTVLDFACGTGTFLLEVCQQIFANIGGAKAGKAGLIVREHILKNLYGFEYLIAPYTVAHLKLSQFLKEQGHPLAGDERLQVFLTNTLEPIAPQANLLLPAVTAEVKAAQEVKEKPILVITGNPPYSGHSRNKGKWITASIAAYREGFPELSKPAQGKWLQDDYVKFIRFAQMKMDAVEEGIVGIITNHSWLDNPTFKGMRKSLMATFNQIYALDLHGNAKKKERAPDGSDDQNVFDIEQGVAISIFIKKPGIEQSIWHADTWGMRFAKYQLVMDKSVSNLAWTRVHPNAPDWLFKPRNAERHLEYQGYWSMRDIFDPSGDPAPGVVSTHDKFAISFTREEAVGKVTRFLATSGENEARGIWKLCSQEQWSYERAKAELPLVDLRVATVEILYQPFDSRWTIWDRNVAVHRRERIMRHMFHENIAINVIRKMDIGGEWSHVLASDRPISHHAVSSKEVNFIFPAYLYDEVAGNGPAEVEKLPRAHENLSLAFRAFLDARYDHHYTPEEILGYIYAVLHAPGYRSRYAEILRIDFPRIPFAEAKTDFDALAKLGSALVGAHLLRLALPRNLAVYHGKGNHQIEAMRYSPQEQAIWINKTQNFSPVPEDVWNFHIGGYQVLDKYLKSRKARTLSLDEIDHVSAVAGVLAFTIAQMAMIDTAYLAAFHGRG